MRERPLALTTQNLIQTFPKVIDQTEGVDTLSPNQAYPLVQRRMSSRLMSCRYSENSLVSSASRAGTSRHQDRYLLPRHQGTRIGKAPGQGLLPHGFGARGTNQVKGTDQVNEWVVIHKIKALHDEGRGLSVRAMGKEQGARSCVRMLAATLEQFENIRLAVGSSPSVWRWVL